MHYQNFLSLHILVDPPVVTNSVALQIEQVAKTLANYN